MGEVRRAKAAVPVPTGVLRGIRRAQEVSGVDNREGVAVVVVAGQLGEDEALDWLLRNPLRYLDGVSNGFVEEA